MKLKTKYKPFIGMQVKQLKSCRFRKLSKTDPEFGEGEDSEGGNGSRD